MFGVRYDQNDGNRKKVENQYYRLLIEFEESRGCGNTCIEDFHSF
jgi:hypothetical protein